MNTMHAVIIEKFGPPEVMEYKKVPVPSVGPDDVAIEVHAVTVNRSLDVAVRASGDGRDPILPLILGTDPSGVICELGSNVKEFAIGDKVAVQSPIPCGSCSACTSGNGSCLRRLHLGVHRWGGYAEQVIVPAKALVKIPHGISFTDASVIVRHYPTAFYLMYQLAALESGETVLIMGATGGLGSAGIEVAKLKGATVIAGVGSDLKAKAAMNLGADFAINYRKDPLDQSVMTITSGKGVNMVFENISDPELWPLAFATLAREGRLVTAGAHGGGTVPLDVRRLYQSRLRIIGGAGSDSVSLQRALDAAEAHILHPLIGKILPLREAKQAHELIESGSVIGKVVLVPNAN